MKVRINNSQRRLRIRPHVLRKLTERFLIKAGAVTAADAEAGAPDVSVGIVDDARMKILNAALLGKAEPTDVLSLRYDPLPGEDGPGSLEIIVNAERALEEGARRRTGRSRTVWSPAHELCLYLAHGCNHLGGWNDRDPDGRRRMRRREMRWIREADAAGLVQNILK